LDRWGLDLYKTVLDMCDIWHHLPGLEQNLEGEKNVGLVDGSIRAISEAIYCLE